jgi:uncharacterized protein (DUF58 family)
MIFSAHEIAQLWHLELLAAKVVRGQLSGERAMRKPGPGSGFREHRAYHPGDALRTVDWHAYARMDALVVKEFDAEEALDLMLVQDCSASMEGKASLCAAKVCAALGAIALHQLDRVLWIPVGGRRTSEAFTGRARLTDLLEKADAATGGPTDLLGTVRAGLPRAARGGVAFLVSDFFDPRSATAALTFLLGRRYRVHAILVEDREALRPPPFGRVRLIDRETGETKTLDLTEQTVADYRRAREARIDGLVHFCRRAGAGFLRVRADQPFFEIVRAAIARGWLGR